jgi:hypothetical protein
LSVAPPPISRSSRADPARAITEEGQLRLPLGALVYLAGLIELRHQRYAGGGPVDATDRFFVPRWFADD